LARGLIQKCHELTVIDGRFDSLLFHDIEIEQISRVIDFCYEALIQNGMLPEYEEVIRQSCSQRNGSTIYDEIKRLSSYFVTTNYDDHFDNYFGTEDVICNFQEIENLGKADNSLIQDKLYHIHGTVREPKNVVLTRKQYYERYGNSHFRAFLRKTFQEHSTLFIGSRIESEIESIVSSAGAKKHFILKRYKNSAYESYTEKNQYDYDAKVFAQFGIQVIPYIGEYSALLDLLKSWNSEIRTTELEVKTLER
jgi:hypothetical protein